MRKYASPFALLVPAHLLCGGSLLHSGRLRVLHGGLLPGPHLLVQLQVLGSHQNAFTLHLCITTPTQTGSWRWGCANTLCLQRAYLTTGYKLS